MARACGSYPQCPRFESRCRYHRRSNSAPFIWPVGQVVKTPPFHGGNMGSNPVRVTRESFDFVVRIKAFFFCSFFICVVAVLVAIRFFTLSRKKQAIFERNSAYDLKSGLP